MHYLDMQDLQLRGMRPQGHARLLIKQVGLLHSRDLHRRMRQLVGQLSQLCQHAQDRPSSLGLDRWLAGFVRFHIPFKRPGLL